MQVAPANALPVDTINPAAAGTNPPTAPDVSFLQIIQSMQGENDVPVAGLRTNGESPAPGISTSTNALQSAPKLRTADFIAATASAPDGGPGAGAASAVPVTMPSRVKRSGSDATASQPNDQGSEMTHGIEVTSAIITPLLVSPEQNLPPPAGTSSTLDDKLIGVFAGDTAHMNDLRAAGDPANFAAAATIPTGNAAVGNQPRPTLFSDENPSSLAASSGTQLGELVPGTTGRPADEFVASQKATENAAVRGRSPSRSAFFENTSESAASTTTQPVEPNPVASLTATVVASSKSVEPSLGSVKSPSEVAGSINKQPIELVTVAKLATSVTPTFKASDEIIGATEPIQRFADNDRPTGEIAAGRSPAKRIPVSGTPSDILIAANDPAGPLSASSAGTNGSVSAEDTTAGSTSDSAFTDKIVASPGTRPVEVTPNQETFAGRSDRTSALRTDSTVAVKGRDSSDTVSTSSRSKSYNVIDEPSGTEVPEPAKPARDLPIGYTNARPGRALPGSRSARSEPGSDNISSAVQQPKAPPQSQPHVTHQTLSAGAGPKDPSLDVSALFHPNEASPAPAASPRALEEQDLSVAASVNPTGPSSPMPATGSSVNASQIQVPTSLPPMEQVKPALMMLTKTFDGANEMTLLLQPAELGRVQIRIARAISGLTNIEIVAEKATTLLTLQKDQPQLHRTLDEAGIPAVGRAVTFHVAPAQPSSEDRHLSVNGQRGSHGQTAQMSGSADGDSSGGGSKSNNAPKKQNAYSAPGRNAGPASLIAANGVPVSGSYRVGLDITA